MALDAWQYGNPEYVLQRKQQAAAKKAAQRQEKCGACGYYRTLFTEPECTRGRWDWRRCTFSTQDSK
jgi:hypothetical protein